MQKTSTPPLKNSDKNSKRPKKSTLDRILSYSKSVMVLSAGSEKWLINLN